LANDNAPLAHALLNAVLTISADKLENVALPVPVVQTPVPPPVVRRLD